MPSLNALGEFKFSFSNIGNEKNNVLSKNETYDDLPLPTTEAPPIEFTRNAPVEEEVTEPEASDDGFDMDSFLNTLPGDSSSLNEPPSIDELFSGISQPSSDSVDQQPESQEPPDDLLKDFGTPTDEQDSTFSSDDFSVPSEEEPAAEDSFPTDDFFSGLSGDTTPTDFDSSTFGTEDFDTDDSGAIDMGGESPAFVPDSGEQKESSTDLPDFDMPDFDMADTPPQSDESFDDNFDGIDMGGESPHTGFETPSGDFDTPADVFKTPADDFDDLPDINETTDDSFDSDGGIDMGGESPDSGISSDFDSPLPDMDFPLDSGIDSSPPDTDFPSSSDFDTPDFPVDSGTAGGGESGTQDFGDDFASESIDLGSGGDSQDAGLSSDGYSSESYGGDDDFTFDGLDEIFDKTKTAAPAPPPQKKGLFKKKKVKAEDIPEAETDVEEIKLTQDDLDRLLKTLSSYPLNLRIACEEMIAEQVLLPKQLSKLIFLLKNNANVRETAALVEEVTGKKIVIPKSFEKMTGAAFEAEQASFAYIFIHNFLPVLRLFAVIAALALSVIYLGYRFIYIPVKAESLYKRGYERIPAGEYQRANQLFHEAFLTHQKKKWFYSYAESFRDQRRYLLAEEKYDELLRYYPRDKKGVLDYANLNTYYLLNYEKANRLLQQQLLDYTPNDYEGLLAAGDNFLLWADSDPDKYGDRYEDARFSYARLIENFGQQPPIMERMLKYFIRTDNLKEVLYLRVWFENDPKKRRLSTSSVAELGGYLLDKQLEEVKGVPDMYVESIESVRDMLLQAVRQEPTLPEPHYHLARYYNNLGNTYEERLTLENAIRAFDLAKTETVSRRLNRVDAHFRYANLLTNNREFFPAEEQLVKGIQLFEDFLSRNLIPATPQLGKLYSAKGDLEYFVKSGDMRAALGDYRLAERYGYSPPEIQYRMGAAYYQLQDWRNSLDYLFKASAELPLNRRLLYALGNVAYQRGDYFAAEGYYSRLLDVLESQRIRLPVLLPNDSPQFLELGERLMMARNNIGVVYEALAEQTGNRDYRSKAMALYAESSRAWDAITRNPETMTRIRLIETPGAPSINLGYLNANNALRSASSYRPEIFPRIDKDVTEPSYWEELATTGGLQ
jgi:tetratricopeptide (TPR) repeat protein